MALTGVDRLTCVTKRISGQRGQAVTHIELEVLGEFFAGTQLHVTNQMNGVFCLQHGSGNDTAVRSSTYYVE